MGRLSVSEVPGAPTFHGSVGHGGTGLGVCRANTDRGSDAQVPNIGCIGSGPKSKLSRLIASPATNVIGRDCVPGFENASMASPYRNGQGVVVVYNRSRTIERGKPPVCWDSMVRGGPTLNGAQVCRNATSKGSPHRKRRINVEF